MREQLGRQLKEVTAAELEKSIGHLLALGYFDNPASVEAQSYVLDHLHEKMRELYFATEVLGTALREAPHGWTDEQLVCVQTGFDMALMVIQEVIDQPG